MNKLRTRKAVYQHVRTHLLKQMKYTVDDNEEVVHRTESCACSMGCLMPDKWFDLKHPLSDGTITFTVPGTGIIWKNRKPFVAEEHYDAGTGAHAMSAIALHHGLTQNTRTARLFHDLERIHEDFEPKDWRAALDDMKYAYGF